MKSFAIVTLLLACGIAHADELKVTPGLWETTTNRTSPMGGSMMTDTVQTCIAGDTYDPKTMMINVEGCNVLDNTVSGNTLNFAMRCSMQGGEVTATGEYQVEGNNGIGKMDMNMAMGPMKMNMKMDWVSRRIGDC